MTTEPITCSGNDLAAVCADIRLRGGCVEAMDVIGRAMYRVSYFPSYPCEARAGTSLRSVGKAEGRGNIAGDVTAGETANFGIRRNRSNATQTSTRPVSEEACKQRDPAMGTEMRADGLTRVSTEGDIAEPSGSGWAHPTNTCLSVEDRLDALQSKLIASGKIKRSKTKTMPDNYRQPYAD